MPYQIERVCLVAWHVIVLHSLAAAQNIMLKNYTVQDGLAGNHIRCIYQDSDGFMWFGTAEGLSKYDGYRFANYTTSNGLGFDYINDIYEISPLKLMIAENDGTTEFIDHDKITPATGAGKAVVNKIFKTNSGTLLAPTDYNGVCKWTDNTWKSLNAYGGFGISVYMDSFYLLVDGWRLSLLNSKLKLIDSVWTDASNINSSSFFSNTSFVDSKKRLWIGTSAGLKLLDTNTFKKGKLSFDKLPPLFPLKHLDKKNVRVVFEDIDHNFWIGTDDAFFK
jgi:ligand-binding sensor domain-containing protein